MAETSDYGSEQRLWPVNSKQGEFCPYIDNNTSQKLCRVLKQEVMNIIKILITWIA